MKSDIFLTENVADLNNADERDVTETSDNELAITNEDGVVTIRCPVYTLQLSVHDFIKANFSAKEVVAKVRKSPKRPTSRISERCSSTKTNLFLDWIVRPAGLNVFNA